MAESLLDLTPPTGDSLLREARAWLTAGLDAGVACPCCGQRAQTYRRTINSGMARALAVMYQSAGLEWLHKPTVLAGLGAAARDESLLRFWDLIEEEITVKRDDGGRAGWWRVTPKGEGFLHRAVTVPKYALVYNNRFQGFHGADITIDDAIASKFNLTDLLEAGLNHQGAPHA